MKVRYGLTCALVALALAAPAQALDIGVQDDGQLRRDATVVFDAGHALDAKRLRIIVGIGQPLGPVAEHVRAARAQGFRVQVVLGGIGTANATSLPRPVVSKVMRYARRAKRALRGVDRWSVWNEPDLSGITPCRYARLWLRARTLFRSRLLFGEFSPYRPVAMTLAAYRCGLRLPRTLDFALHPYQALSDPLAPGADEGSIGSLGRLRHALRPLRLRLWISEFGYSTIGAGAATPEQTAWLWPRAIQQARRQHARELVVYQMVPTVAGSRGLTWDTHLLDTPAWCTLTRRCAAASRPVSEPPVPSFEEAEGHGY